MFIWRDSGRLVDRAVTDRWGGVSLGPYEGFNLAAHVGDDPDAVEANRQALAAAVKVPRERLVFMNQVHGDRVVVIERPWSAPPPPADAVVTKASGLALVVLVADCVPVLMADPQAGVVAAVHAGRPGMVADIVGRVVTTMRGLGARTIDAVVGPSVCPRCYEVPQAMREEAAAVAPVSAGVSWQGTPAIDVAAGVVDQLRQRDVAVTWLPGCTRERPELYSYREHRQTGRFAGIIVRRER